MEENRLYSYLEELAEKKFKVDKLTPLQLLYAYASVASMNDSVINVYFSDEKDREEIIHIREEIERQGLDTTLLKTAIPLIDGKEGVETQTRQVDNIREKAEKDHSDVFALTVLQNLILLEIPELPLMKKGRELKDIFAYINHDDAAKPAAKEVTKEKEESGPESGSATMFSGKEIFGKKDEADAENEDGEAETEEASEEDGTENLSQRERLEILLNKTKQLYEYLNEKNPGQMEAVHGFVQNYFRSELLCDSENIRKGVSGIMLLSGPREVNKPGLLHQAAEFLKMPILNMDNIGSEKEPVKALFEFVDHNPRCFILASEMELVTPSMVSLLCDIIDGDLKAERKDGKKVDFKKAVMVCTTDVGRELYEDRSQRFSRAGFAVILDALKEDMLSSDKKKPVPESWTERFLSNFSGENTILFDRLDAFTLYDVIRKDLDKGAAAIMETYGLHTEIDPKLAQLLLYKNNWITGADEIRAQSESLVKDELFDLGRHMNDLRSSLPKLENLRMVLEYDDDGEDVRELFENPDGLHALYLGDELDPKEYCLPENYRITYCDDEEKAKKIAIEEDIDIVLIDPLFGEQDNTGYLSIDDRKSMGIRVFEELTRRLTQVPVYLVEKKELPLHEEIELREKGAWGALSLQDPLAFSNRLVQIGNMLYTRKKVNELYAKAKTLEYNSAQKISDDGKTAEIHIYDLAIRKQMISDPQHMMLAAGDRPKERFADVIGAEDAKEELQIFINYMKNPRPFMMNSTQPPKGILLYGPPGTGKTMLARAMAGESDASYFAVTGNSFADKFYGESEKSIRRLFMTARRCAPSIIFIDEIDSIGKKRTGSFNEARESDLNTLIAEMDGFHQDPTRPVFVIAATNYGIGKNNDGGSMQLDEALTRRFARAIKVDLPKQDERVRFLKMQIGKLQKSDVSDDAIKTLADRTTGESLAILKNILDTALRRSSVSGEPVNDEMLLAAMEEYRFGEKKEWNPETTRATAIHESGHTYISVLSGEKPPYVTIVSRGNFGGYMAHEVREDVMDHTKEDLLWQIRSGLAGRAAEQLFYNDRSGTNTGASSDLRQATNVALEMICLYGMDENRLYSIDPARAMQSPMAGELLQQVNVLMRQEMEVTKRLVEEGKEYIEKMADFLVKNNEATTEDIMSVMGECLGKGRTA
ncbi:MAG: AAA family ATPase [Lachnospiraceae bacterium]|nr:AAA family ATPase [Lachnospiraceae bacterium]